MLITKCDSQLYYPQHVHVTPHSLIMVVGPSFEITNRSSDDPWKLGVLPVQSALASQGSLGAHHGNILHSRSGCTHHGDVGVLVDGIAQSLKLAIKVVRPDLTFP